jgi:hypothetical protein
MLCESAEISCDALVHLSLFVRTDHQIPTLWLAYATHPASTIQLDDLSNQSTSLVLKKRQLGKAILGLFTGFKIFFATPTTKNKIMKPATASCHIILLDFVVSKGNIFTLNIYIYFLRLQYTRYNYCTALFHRGVPCRGYRIKFTLGAPSQNFPKMKNYKNKKCRTV